MTRKCLPAVLLFALLAAAAPARSQGSDVLARLGVNPSAARAAIVETLASGTIYDDAAFKAFKAMAPAVRAAIVRAGLAWAKAYTATPEFKAEYAKYRVAQTPVKPEAGLSVDEYLKKQRLEMEKQAAEARKAAAGLDAATRKSMEDGIKQMMAQVEAMEKDPAQRARLKDLLEAEKADVKARYEEALAEWNKRTPADPKTLIADRIREFLETSADVDYGAKLVKRGSLMRFENEEYESRSSQWKLCFRAGKEAVDAARVLAQAWLAELEK
jgi:hypothetical protein